MCLDTREELPRIAKRDIVCLKILKKEFNGVYETPYQGVRVQLNSKIEAFPKIVDISFSEKDCLDNTIYSVNGGAIHSLLLDEDSCKGSHCIKKAIIPKGTEYYLGCFGLEVASKELYITDRNGSIKDLDVQFLEELLEEAPTCNGVRVGDFLMTDSKFVHPRKNLPKTKTIGMVVGFHDETPLIAALDRFIDVPFGDYSSDIIDGLFTYRESAMQDFNGKEHTKKHVEYANNKEHKHIYKAFSECVTYKKNGTGNWYLPALGEMMQMLNNALYINVAYLISGLGYLVDTAGWYCTSSEGNSDCSWACDLRSGKVRCNWYCRSKRFRVVPFLAYNDEQGKPTGLISKKKSLDGRSSN